MSHKKPNRYNTRYLATKKSLQSGMGLIELMVAMVLGLILVGGVLGIFISNQQVFTTNENLGRLQENARVSFELMAREIRQSGGNLCGAKVTSNVLNDSATEWSSNWDAGGIIGFDDTVETTAVAIGTAANERVEDTDALQILGSGWGETATITAHDSATAKISLNPSSHKFAKGDLVVICDNKSAAIAQLSDVVAENVFHAAVAADSPGNCAPGLGSPTVCTGTGTSKTMEAGGFVSDLSAGTWFIANNSRGGKSLYRTSSSGSEEIAEGVVDMQLTYLLQTTATGVPDTTWVSASSVGDWTSSAAKQVTAIRVKLTLETPGNIGTNQSPISRDLVYIVNLRNRLS